MTLSRFSPDNQQATDFIVQEFFPYLQGQSVVELGSSLDCFTENIAEKAEKLVCIEFDPTVVEQLKQKNYKNTEVIYGDFHEEVRTVGQYDAVVIYGILYHSCAPLGLLEDIVNYIKPKIILIEALHDYNTIYGIDEEPNRIGMRWVDKKSCKIVLDIGFPIYKLALENLGYRCLKSKKNEYGDKAWKKDFTYAVFITDHL